MTIKILLLTILTVLSLDYLILSVVGCIQWKVGGIEKMPFRDLEISEGENELFYASIVNLRNYGAISDGVFDCTNAFNLAIQASSNKTLLLPSGTYRIANSITIPNDVSLFLSNGAKISVDSGKTLTINGKLFAGIYQIFTGSGSVVITKGATEALYPEWWGAVGDGSTDDTDALQACIDCATTVGNVNVVKLSEKTYKITSALTTTGGGINIVGVSMNRSWILASGGCDGLRITPPVSGTNQENILLHNFRIYSDSVTTGYGIYINGHRDLTIDHVWIGGYYDYYKGFEYGIYATAQPTYYLRVINSRVFYCKYGIYLNTGANSAVIENNTIRYGQYCVVVGYVGGTKIVSNSIETDANATAGGNPATVRLITLTNSANNTVIANNYLEHHSNQPIELQSGVTRTRIYGNSHGVWLYDKSDVLDNSGNETNYYDDKIILRANKDVPAQYYTDNVGGIIDMQLGTYSDHQHSVDYHPTDMRIRAHNGYLSLYTERGNRHIELASHTDARTLVTPYGGFGKKYSNLLKYSEAFSSWGSVIGTVTDNIAVSPTGEVNASRLVGYYVAVGGGSFVSNLANDGDIVVFSVWLRSPEYSKSYSYTKQKCALVVTNGYGRVFGRYYCEVDNEWRRYCLPVIANGGSGPYGLSPFVFTQRIQDSQDHTLELYGAQLVNIGSSITGTVESKVSSTTKYLMDIDRDFASYGVNVGSLVYLYTNSSSVGGAYVSEIESCLGFTSGNGTEPSVGDVVSVTSTKASAVITEVVIESGSFANGNAEGWLRIKNVRNTFGSGDTLTFPNATASYDYFSRNCILAFAKNIVYAIIGTKNTCDNGDTYYIATKEKIVPQPYVRTDGAIITGEDASFYSDKVVTRSLTTSSLAASLGNNLAVGDYGIHISASPSDNKWSGMTITLTAGENLSLGDVCYMNSSGKMVKADADDIATSGVIAIATANISNNSNGVFLLNGVIHLHTLNPDWTVGGLVYLSTTAGCMTQTAPSGSDDVIQVLGVAIGSDILLFNPNLIMVEHN